MSALTIALMFGRNALISVVLFTPSVNVSIHIDASVKIQTGSGPIKRVNTSVSADTRCEHSLNGVIPNLDRKIRRAEIKLMSQ